MGRRFSRCAVEFLAANHITGRCFNDWQWEGYLHWKYPGLKLFIGGRAHQVYDEATDRQAMRILTDTRVYSDPRDELNPTKDLAAIDVHLVVVPADSNNMPLIWHLTERPDATWAYIYFDADDVITLGADPPVIVAADTAWPPTAELVRRAMAGDLVYPDEAIASMSRAMAMTSPALKIPDAQTLEAFLKAAEVQPTTFTYSAIGQLAKALSKPLEWKKAYFQAEYARLAARDYNQAGGERIPLMRALLADCLATVCRDEGDAEEASRWATAKEQAAAVYQFLENTWP